MLRKLGFVISYVSLIIFVSGSSPYDPLNNLLPDTDAKKMEEVFDVSSGQKLTVNIKLGGDIDVTGWDKEQISVEVLIKGDDADEVDVDYDQSSSGLEITAKYIGDRNNYDANADFTIMVPSRFDVEFSTMGGDGTLKKVEGQLEGTTMGGDITLYELKGNLEITTMGGDVKLTDSDVDGYVKTMGGDVRVENVTGNVSASSMGGDIIQKNVKRRTGDSIGDEVNISTMGGDLVIDEAADGAKLETMGGDIKANYVAKFLEASTMGGDISVDAVDGWIEASTMGGDVKVKMVGDPDKGSRDVSLSSMGGDIWLSVPDGLSMKLDLDIVYDKRHEDDVEIVSDFEFDEERKEVTDDDDDSPRWHLLGTGTINGGKNRVKIKTVNGKIYLRKN
jgi:DUF4097 and DUF4098 domain-containing protein YvlB